MDKKDLIKKARAMWIMAHANWKTETIEKQIREKEFVIDADKDIIEDKVVQIESEKKNDSKSDTTQGSALENAMVLMMQSQIETNWKLDKLIDTIAINNTSKEKTEEEKKAEMLPVNDRKIVYKNLYAVHRVTWVWDWWRPFIDMNRIGKIFNTQREAWEHWVKVCWVNKFVIQTIHEPSSIK